MPCYSIWLKIRKVLDKVHKFLFGKQLDGYAIMLYLWRKNLKRCMQITTKSYIKYSHSRIGNEYTTNQNITLTKSLVLLWCLHQEAHFWEFISPTNIQSHKQDPILLQANLVSVGLPCTVKLLSSKTKHHCYYTVLLWLMFNDYIDLQ